MNRECEDRQETGQLGGRYANYFKIGYNAFEFLLDFGQFYPESKEARLHTRIIITPSYAKALFATLQEAIDQYEQTFGAIPEQDERGPSKAGEDNRLGAD